jgi:hypothetical protein
MSPQDHAKRLTALVNSVGKRTTTIKAVNASPYAATCWTAPDFHTMQNIVHLRFKITLIQIKSRVFSEQQRRL